MMRATVLSAAALLAATLLAPTTAHAAGETCQGRPARVVGTDNEPLAGTEGPDVIVTNGASPVHALGGDDLVCATGTVVRRRRPRPAWPSSTQAPATTSSRSSRRPLRPPGPSSATAPTPSSPPTIASSTVVAGRSTTSGILTVLDTEPDVVRIAALGDRHDRGARGRQRRRRRHRLGVPPVERPPGRTRRGTAGRGGPAPQVVRR